MEYKDIKEFNERCEEHPDHQTGMISYGMIQQRLQEEIDELREYIEQRTWVGLTDEEIADCAEKMEASDPTDSFWREFFRGIEAKLKQKNT
jgi:hypothetical protein